ncbi:hypothetical protein ACQPXB_36165 [Amycolatopsis sp. CA-161197]|uniref:hypothetical protein n=1 Tax=Amycolatopsis sp. CA-161197 TaxID=3239922 RepID=UPI003D9485D1
MPLLHGPKVRHRAAARGWDLITLAAKSHIPKRAVQNCTRPQNPQPMHLARIYALAGALADGTGEDELDVFADIVDDAEVVAAALAAKDDPKKEEPRREPTGPTRRQENERTTGPKRATDRGAAA